MAFWDDLGKKASAATSKAVQKAQDMSETAKLNSMISDEEKQISIAYSQIGKLYVEFHREDGEEAFSELLGVIRDAEEKINSCRKQILDMRRTLRCEKCGAEVSKDSTFCSFCGAQIIQEKELDNTPRCEKCGAPITDWMRFCTVCGNPLQQPAFKEDSGEDGAVEPQLTIIETTGEAFAEPERVADLCTAEKDGAEDAKIVSADAKAGASTVLPGKPTENDWTEQLEEAVSSAPQTTMRVCPHCGAEVDDDQLFCIECGNSL